MSASESPGRAGASTVTNVEERLREREEILAAIFEQAADGIVLIDVETQRFVEFNDAACAALGYTRDEFAQLTLCDLQEALAPAELAEKLAEVVAARGGVFEIRHRCKGGSFRDVLVANRLIHLRGRPFLAAVWHDMTERKLAEAARLESERILRAAIETIDEGFVLYDSEDHLVLCNEKYRQIYAASADLIVPGARFEDIIRIGAMRGQYTEAAGRTDEWVAERMAAHYGGDSCLEQQLDGGRWLRIVERRTPDGYLVGFRVDITELKNKEIELSRHRDHLEELVAERTAQLEAANRAKTDFLANLSHEIRTPMNAIVGLTHLAARRSQDIEQRSLLGKVATAAEHLLAVINDILDISKIEAGKVELQEADFVLVRTLENALALVDEAARDKCLTLSLDIAADLPPVLRGDPLRFGQIVINLVNNAVKFTDSGTVAVRAGRRQRTGGDGKGSRLRVEVEDTGIGVAPEVHQRLFNAFEQADLSTTRRYGGTGLGLAIARRLVELMGGEIGVVSEPGHGSRFWFEVPLHVGGAVPMPPGADSLDTATLERDLVSRCRGRSVLLVEDNPVNQEVTRELLRDTGLVIEVAGDGAEGVAMAQQRRYDIILMDVQMPVMDGLDACRALRRLPGWAQTPVVALTANAFSEDQERCRAAGMSDFLAKPVTSEGLFRTLLKWLPGVPVAPAAAAPQPAIIAGDDQDQRRRLEAIAGLDVAAGLQCVRDRLPTYQRLLGKFVETHQSDMAAVRERLAAADCAEARRLAHSLKGAAATLGARDLAASALELEQALKQQLDEGRCDVSAVEPLIAAVAGVWEPLAGALQKALSA